MTLNMRRTLDEDKTKMLDLFQYSYGMAPTNLDRTFDVVKDEYYSIIQDDEVVANIRAIPFEQNIRGTFKKMAGICDIVCDPVARRKGYIREGLKQIFADLHEEGTATSTLTPFKDSFYEKMGYINCVPYRNVIVQTKWLQHWNQLPEGYTFKKMRLKDGYKLIKDFHRTAISKIHGGVPRTDKRWKEAWGNSDRWLIIIYNPEKEVEGMMHYAHKGYGDRLFGEDNIGTISVLDFYPITPAGKHGLLHVLYLNSDQIIQVNLPLNPHEENIYAWFSGFAKTKTPHHIVNMARIIDATACLADLPVTHQTSDIIQFQLTDPDCAWNNLHLALSVQNGKIHVEKLEGDTPNMKITIQGLTAIVYGVMPYPELTYFKWIQNASAQDLAILKLWFPLSPTWLAEFF
ncbi:enhanced intracellular survival protein Eis [Candidatus Lokiarchaeum ossiferum]|uniref:enhanced intracellular survival protein Eis n=1 Tax=Candidatus Lokiarchaeum ossiferum TaxID=2951803 RepID=UPI00352C5365